MYVGDTTVSSLLAIDGIFVLTAVTHGIAFGCARVSNLLTTIVDKDRIEPCYIVEWLNWMDHSSYAPEREYMKGCLEDLALEV